MKTCKMFFFHFYICVFVYVVYQAHLMVLFVFQFPSVFGVHNLQWEGVWRELACLTQATSMAVREQAGHSLKSSLKVSD